MPFQAILLLKIINRGRYVLPAAPKGSTRTSLGPIPQAPIHSTVGRVYVPQTLLKVALIRTEISMIKGSNMGKC